MAEETDDFGLKRDAGPEADRIQVTGVIKDRRGPAAALAPVRSEANKP
jgi:hypothetical protein